MFKNALAWLKTNKLVAILVLVVLYLLLGKNNSVSLLTRNSVSSIGGGYAESEPMYYDKAAPTPDVTNRMVTTNSYISAVVKKVRDSVTALKTKAVQLNGYMVASNVSDSGYAASGYITVRVPSNKLDEFMSYTRELATKIVAETVSGEDITDQYVDIQARLTRLANTIQIFEAMLNKATTVDEILKIQQELLNIQSQIDSYKGRLAYMEGISSTTLISINLSTDELELPYTPGSPWRPQVIFKNAVRSLVQTLQQVGTAGIYIAVYGMLLIPVGGIIYAIYKAKSAKRLLK